MFFNWQVFTLIFHYSTSDCWWSWWPLCADGEWEWWLVVWWWPGSAGKDLLEWWTWWIQAHSDGTSCEISQTECTLMTKVFTIDTGCIQLLIFLLCDVMRKCSPCCRPVSVCLFIRLSVTFVYYIQRTADIVRLLSRLGSPIILVFNSKHWYPVPRGTLSVGLQNTRVLGKICDFQLKSPFISETVQNRPMLAMARWPTTRLFCVVCCAFEA